MPYVLTSHTLFESSQMTGFAAIPLMLMVDYYAALSKFATVNPLNLGHVRLYGFRTRDFCVKVLCHKHSPRDKPTSGS